MKINASLQSLFCAAVLGVNQSNGFLASVSIVRRQRLTLNAHGPQENGRVFGFQDRPLLKKFGQDIHRRVMDSAQGRHRKGKVGAYTSKEIIPRLDMQCSTAAYGLNDLSIASRQEIREAFSESETTFNSRLHGRSSGSGCVIIRLQGEDAVAMHKLVSYADRFFDQVDSIEGKEVADVGVFRVANHVYVGFDENVNDGKMQFLDTRIFSGTEGGGHNATLLPIELQTLMGSASMNDARNGMNTLFDIGSQITSAVLRMTSKSANKLIDDGTSVDETTLVLANKVSNSYHRLIRYLQPDENATGAAFEPHVDSSFLTMIPMPKLPGLEIWCPSRSTKDDGSREWGEWVQPTLQTDEQLNDGNAYIIVMAGHFLELTSDGKVPTCIHRVIPPSNKNTGMYQPRISGPLFLRPRIGEDALLDVDNDLKLESDKSSTEPMTNGLYHEKGLLDECDKMHLWSAHDVIKS